MASSISPLGTGPVCSDTNWRDPADSRPRYRPSRVGGGASGTESGRAPTCPSDKET